MTSLIDYKPFFWNDMIDGTHSGGYKVGKVAKKTQPQKYRKVDTTGAKLLQSDNEAAEEKLGGAIVDDNIIERFHNLVVPVGFVLLNENNAPQKYNEHSTVGVIDDVLFNKLFIPLVVNKSNKKRITKKK